MQWVEAGSPFIYMGFDAVFTEFLQVYPVELLGHFMHKIVKC